MIDLTPLDVRKKRGDFKKAMRGYLPEEVDAFLDVAALRLEELVKENLALREQVVRLQADVEGLSGRERAVQEALVTAQSLREDMREQSRREADLARREAELALKEKERELAEREAALAKASQPKTSSKPATTRPAPAPSKPAPTPVASGPKDYVVPAGTSLSVQLPAAISTRTAQVGQRISGNLTNDIVVNGKTVAKAGALVQGSPAPRPSNARSTVSAMAAASIGPDTLTTMLRAV